MLIFLQRCHSSFKQGFTVVELLVVVAVITALTAVMLLQQQRFDSTTLLRSLAYRTALSVREAQSYGTSVRLTGTAAPAYGIYLTTGSNTTYYLFADVNNDRCRAGDAVCPANPGTEDIDTFTLGSNYTINRFLARTSSFTHTSGAEITSLTIFFIRPNPDACFATSAGTNSCAASPPYAYQNAEIQLRAPSGSTRSVMITNTGQISVGNVGS